MPPFNFLPFTYTFSFFFSSFFAATAAGAACGRLVFLLRVFPCEPLQILPLVVLLSPLPMIGLFF
jgi:hypothetical protein